VNKFLDKLQPRTTTALPAPSRAVTEESLHANIKRLIVEIGKMQKFIAEEEYQMQNERLDVVWRRVEKSVPTYVFEIQVSGDLHHTLAKLKHAHDLWNSNIFLICLKQERPKTEALLGGPFTRSNKLWGLSTSTTSRNCISEKKAYHEFESQLGIV
jgi:hypothetical protein